MICGLLTQQYSVVNDDQKATQSNSVVREFHQDVFSDVVSTKISATPFMHQSGWTFSLYRFYTGLLTWRSCESAHLLSVCPGFDSWTRRHIWVEFVFWFSSLLREIFLGVLRFSPLHNNPTFPNSNSSLESVHFLKLFSNHNFHFIREARPRVMCFHNLFPPIDMWSHQIVWFLENTLTWPGAPNERFFPKTSELSQMDFSMF